MADQQIVEDRERAPGRLAVVQDFINTFEVEAATEELADADALAAWLGARDLLDAGVRLGPSDLVRARELREQLRTLLEDRAHGGAQAATVAALNALGARALLVASLDADGAVTLAPAADGLDGAFASLLAIVARATLDGTWERLKVCSDDGCRWAFYDRSRNRSGSWCSMAVCGNRAKARNFRARQRVDRGAGGAGGAGGAPG
jgi:predicted RNA-binding Zn ribbon-like protein